MNQTRDLGKRTLRHDGEGARLVQISHGYGQDKCPDREAIPLCECHHQGEWDTTNIAIHADLALWVDHYGSDRDYIAVTLDAVERLRLGSSHEV